MKTRNLFSLFFAFLNPEGAFLTASNGYELTRQNHEAHTLSSNGHLQVNNGSFLLKPTKLPGVRTPSSKRSFFRMSLDRVSPAKLGERLTFGLFKQAPSFLPYPIRRLNHQTGFPFHIPIVSLILPFPALLMKLGVLWGLVKISSIRPHRKMLEKAEQKSGETRILFPNEIQASMDQLEGLEGVLPAFGTNVTDLGKNMPKKSPLWPLKRVFNRFLPGLGKASKQNDVSSPKGYLFVGPPGTGKTRLAQAVAKEANLPLICISSSEIQKQIEIGTRIGALRLRKIFDTAREYAPCILFFDEIDAIGKTRGNIYGIGSSGEGGSGETPTNENQLLTEFLIQMDSFSQKDGFIVIGTTNFLNQLDSAFIRSGRFDRVLHMGLPSQPIRTKILQTLAGLKVERGSSPVSSQERPAVQLIPGRARNVNSRPTTRSFQKNGTSANRKQIPYTYFGLYTKGYTQADLAGVLKESILFQSSVLLSNPQKDSKLEHTFESLQKGFNRIQRHRKQF